MNNKSLIWIILFVVGAAFLIVRYSMTGMGSQYVKLTEISKVQIDVPSADGTATEAKWFDANDPAVQDKDILATINWTEESKSSRNVFDAAQEANGGAPVDGSTIVFSTKNTLGVWLGAILTLAILSFLLGDNPFYKTGEAIVIGSSAAYLMVIAFWTSLIPNMLGKLSPGLVRGWSTPGLSEEATSELIYIVPLVMSFMLLWRLMPKGGWISRWPLAFFIGATAGIRLVAHLESDFIVQISSTIIPLWVRDGSGAFDFWATVGNWTIVVGIVSCLIYFFFSVEHKGVVGKVSRLGVWVLMVTFGAGFGFTVMGRIALLSARFQFLLDDWLWLIDPMQRHSGT